MNPKNIDEYEPSFPDPNSDERDWERLKNKRPFERFTGEGFGVDYHKDHHYDGYLGGFIGTRLQQGYKLLKDDDIDEE